MQIATEQQKEIMSFVNDTCKSMSIDVSSICVFSEQIANNVSEMRDIQYQGLQELEAINKNTANLFAIKDDIAELRKVAKEYWQ